MGIRDRLEAGTEALVHEALGGAGVVITDPAPLVSPAGLCPSCHAKPSRRIEGGGFGRKPKPQICGACGFTFPIGS